MDYLTGGDLPATQTPGIEKTEAAVPSDKDTAGYDAAVWRQEVSARLERYRSRRKPRAPKYPSLLLPFEAGESWVASTSFAEATGTVAAPILRSVSAQGGEQPVADAALLFSQPAELEPETTAKIIEFPRSAAIPVLQASELAESVWERPRIVEAPEVVPSPPALGGILIEPAPDREKDKRPDRDFPLLQASLGRRLFANLVDGAVVMAALAVFGAIFLRLNPGHVPVPLLTAAGVFAGALLWAGFEFLLLVHAGTTPGMLAARLGLVRFDGTPVPRRLRRWRVLASYLSALALGLGYLWCVLDEDALCWHDRITRTHVSPWSNAKS